MTLLHFLEAGHSKKTTLMVISWVGDDKKRFDELVSIVCGNEKEFSRRAAWPMSYLLESHPDWINKHVGKLIDKISEPKVHPALPRNVMRALQFTTPPDKECGKVFDYCIKVINEQETPVAIRAFAMTAAYNVCKKFPDLKLELAEVIIIGMPFGTSGYVNRGNKILKALENL